MKRIKRNKKFRNYYRLLKNKIIALQIIQMKFNNKNNFRLLMKIKIQKQYKKSNKIMRIN